MILRCSCKVRRCTPHTAAAEPGRAQRGSKLRTALQPNQIPSRQTNFRAHIFAMTYTSLAEQGQCDAHSRTQHPVQQYSQKLLRALALRSPRRPHRKASPPPPRPSSTSPPAILAPQPPALSRACRGSCLPAAVLLGVRRPRRRSPRSRRETTWTSTL